jgi:hypothetical protein
MLKSMIAAGLLAGLGFASASQAASMTYFLDQSDKMADGVNYLQVTIDDEGDPGAVNFTVAMLQPLVDIATGARAGITKFAFNALPGVNIRYRNVDISDFPRGWAVSPNQEMGGFGRYDMRLRITSARTPRTDSISFSILGVNLDTIASYVDLARNSTEGPSFFSARVEGLSLPCAARSSTRSSTCKPTDAFFGGAQAVPAPPAIWLLGTALGAVAVRRFRKAA